MRLFNAVASAVSVAVLAACAADDIVGSSDRSGLTPALGPEVTAANSTSGVPGSVKVYCINPTSCFAVAFDFTDNRDDPVLGRTTVFSLYVQNLQGTYPSDGPSTPLNLNRFRFQFFDTQESADFVDAYPIETFSALGNVQVGANNQWSNDGPAFGRNSDVFVAELGSGILGCDVHAANPPLWFTYRTCPSEGLDGWVRIDFILRHSGFAPTKAPVRLHDFDFWFGDGFTPGHYCTLGGDQPETCTVLPYKKAVLP